MSCAPGLSGVIAAIATPVTAAGIPDSVRFIALARQLLEFCDGLNVLGTTGEATSFSIEQRMDLMSVAARELPHERMMVGTGAAALEDAIRLTRHAAALGFAGALLLPPFYYKGVAESGIVAFVSAVVESTAAIPIYLYNFPALSGVPYTLAIVQSLLGRFPARIAGLKDSSGDLAYARSVAALSPRLRVFPSNEAVLIEARRGDFAGCISATANLNARYCARAFHQGDEHALEQAVAVRRLLDGLPLIPGVKQLLSEEYQDPALARVVPPLVPLTEGELAEIRKRKLALSDGGHGE